MSVDRFVVLYEAGLAQPRDRHDKLKLASRWHIYKTVTQLTHGDMRERITAQKKGDRSRPRYRHWRD